MLCQLHLRRICLHVRKCAAPSLLYCPAVGIEMAQKDGIDWLLHVDTDELIYPSGSPNFSLQVRLGQAACAARVLGFGTDWQARFPLLIVLNAVPAPVAPVCAGSAAQRACRR